MYRGFVWGSILHGNKRQTRGYPGPVAHLNRLADGTITQVNPFTGTQVWTVPGRANRPLALSRPPGQRVRASERGRRCAFCERRYLETTPERRRVVRLGSQWGTFDDLAATRVFDTSAEFRVFANLFEIVSFDYWRLNHGYQPTETDLARQHAYLANPAGRDHVRELLATRARAKGEQPPRDLVEASTGFFAGCHDVVVARRHLVPDAERDDELAGSGTLTPDEHEQYLRLTVDSLHRLHTINPAVKLVSVFQNWLSPAGASFNHLHKQLVGVDTLGPDLGDQLARLEQEPDLYQRWGLDFPEEQGLVIARNDSAVMTAGVGHRFPAVEVWSTVPGRPWELDDKALRDWSDLVHAAHAATGVGVPTNEEWHYQPPSVAAPMPLRAIVKWRLSTPAGFEGGTRIYVNTIDPWTLRRRVHDQLLPLVRSAAVRSVTLV